MELLSLGHLARLLGDTGDMRAATADAPPFGNKERTEALTYFLKLTEKTHALLKSSFPERGDHWTMRASLQQSPPC
jgi:hypothetical protein